MNPIVVGASHPVQIVLVTDLGTATVTALTDGHLLGFSVLSDPKIYRLCAVVTTQVLAVIAPLATGLDEISVVLQFVDGFDASVAIGVSHVTFGKKQAHQFVRPMIRR